MTSETRLAAPSGTEPATSPPTTPDLPTKLSKTIKLACLGLGLLMLAGSVAAASVIIRSTALAAPKPAQATEITGLTALRPDLLANKLGAATPSTPNAAAAVARDTNDDRSARVPTQDSLPATDIPPDTTVPRAPATPVEVVREFYKLVTTQPDTAYRMVDPGLLGSDPAGFARSWTTVRSVRVVRVVPQPGGTVLATVVMQQVDGAWLHVQQLLTVATGRQTRIVGAEVLSAQRG